MGDNFNKLLQANQDWLGVAEIDRLVATTTSEEGRVILADAAQLQGESRKIIWQSSAKAALTFLPRFDVTSAEATRILLSAGEITQDADEQYTIRLRATRLRLNAGDLRKIAESGDKEAITALVGNTDESGLNKQSEIIAYLLNTLPTKDDADWRAISILIRDIRDQKPKTKLQIERLVKEAIKAGQTGLVYDMLNLPWIREETDVWEAAIKAAAGLPDMEKTVTATWDQYGKAELKPGESQTLKNWGARRSSPAAPTFLQGNTPIDESALNEAYKEVEIYLAWLQKDFGEHEKTLKSTWIKILQSPQVSENWAATTGLKLALESETTVTWSWARVPVWLQDPEKLLEDTKALQDMQKQAEIANMVKAADRTRALPFAAFEWLQENLDRENKQQKNLWARMQKAAGEEELPSAGWAPIRSPLYETWPEVTNIAVVLKTENLTAGGQWLLERILQEELKNPGREDEIRKTAGALMQSKSASLGDIVGALKEVRAKTRTHPKKPAGQNAAKKSETKPPKPGKKL